MLLKSGRFLLVAGLGPKLTFHGGVHFVFAIELNFAEALQS